MGCQPHTPAALTWGKKPPVSRGAKDLSKERKSVPAGTRIPDFPVHNSGVTILDLRFLQCGLTKIFEDLVFHDANSVTQTYSLIRAIMCQVHIH